MFIYHAYTFLTVNLKVTRTTLTLMCDKQNFHSKKCFNISWNTTTQGQFKKTIKNAVCLEFIIEQVQVLNTTIRLKKCNN